MASAFTSPAACTTTQREAPTSARDCLVLASPSSSPSSSPSPIRTASCYNLFEISWWKFRLRLVETSSAKLSSPSTTTWTSLWTEIRSASSCWPSWRTTRWIWLVNRNCVFWASFAFWKRSLQSLILILTWKESLTVQWTTCWKCWESTNIAVWLGPSFNLMKRQRSSPTASRLRSSKCWMARSPPSCLQRPARCKWTRHGLVMRMLMPAAIQKAASYAPSISSAAATDRPYQMWITSMSCFGSSKKRSKFWSLMRWRSNNVRARKSRTSEIMTWLPS